MSTEQAVFSSGAEQTERRPVHKLRVRFLGLIKGAAVTWVWAALLAFQAHTLDAVRPAPHPLHQLLQAGRVQVDTTAVTVVARLSEPPSYDLSGWKPMLQGVAGSLVVSGGDVPRNWELTAEVTEGFRTLRYEGRGLQGTHCLVSADQMGWDQTVYVAVRSEIRGLPEDLRLAAYDLQRDVKRGLGPIAAGFHETRIVVTGRTDVRIGYSLAAFGEELLQALHVGDNLRVREEPGAVSVAGYTPYLERAEQGAMNIEVQLVPEGARTRVTVATPQLAAADAALLAGRTTTVGYTSLGSGQTTLAR